MTQDYQPENSPPESSPGLSPKPSADNTASLMRRLAAGFVDLFLVNFFVTPVTYALGLQAATEDPFNMTLEVAVQVLVCSVLVFFVANGYLLARRGQTLGKKLLKIAIVDVNGEPAGIVNLVFNRYLIQLAMLIIPLLNPVDYLTMFIRRDRRCLHDLLAKTKVIDLGVKVKVDHKSLIA